MQVHNSDKHYRRSTRKGTAASSAYPAIYADLTAASGVTINNLRHALQIQVIIMIIRRYIYASTQF